MKRDAAKSEKGLSMELNCPGRGEMLSILRNFVSGVAREMGFSDEEIAKIEISVDEACANVVKHAYRRDHEEEISKREMSIKIKADEERLNIIISDGGVGARKGPHKGVSDVGEFIEKGHGLGTYIIHNFMDEVEVRYPEGRGTVISMIKFLQRGA